MKSHYSPDSRALTVLALLVLFLVAACSDPVAVEPLPPDAVVLAFGDSVTHGTGAGGGQDYPRRLATRSGLEVINAGIPGDTAAEATVRIGAALDRHQPDLVIVELGGNDFLARRSPAQVKDDLRTIVEIVRNRGIATVLVAVPEFSVLRATTGTLKDSPIYAELGRELEVVVIGDVFADTLSAESLRADPIHPNAAGYRVLADGIHRALVEEGFIPE